MTEQNQADGLGRKAHVEVNDRMIAVRLRTLNRDRTEQNAAMICYETTELGLVRERPRLSTDEQSWTSYFVIESAINGNVLADKIKALLTSFGYELTSERFPR